LITIGIVEDNPDFREELTFQLTGLGFQIAFEDDGSNVDAKLNTCACEILLLDLGLPKEDGTVIAQRVRKNHPNTGIVMVTARSTMTNKLEGLNLGADAYLIKPVNIEELAATIRAVHRRTEPTQNDMPMAEQGWDLHLHTLRLSTPNGTEVQLTPREMQLLHCLASSSPQPASRKELVTSIGDNWEHGYDPRRLEVSFSRIRKKIDAVYRGEPVIRSARNLGYVFGDRIVISES
jgi:DNA-binding response OmpR family regulator